MTQTKLRYLLGNHGNNHSGYAVCHALTVPCPTLTSHLQTYQELQTQINKTGNMFILLLDTHTVM